MTWGAKQLELAILVFENLVHASGYCVLYFICFVCFRLHLLSCITSIAALTAPPQAASTPPPPQAALTHPQAALTSPQAALTPPPQAALTPPQAVLTPHKQHWPPHKRYWPPTSSIDPPQAALTPSQATVTPPPTSSIDPPTSNSDPPAWPCMEVYLTELLIAESLDLLLNKIFLAMSYSRQPYASGGRKDSYSATGSASSAAAYRRPSVTYTSYRLVKRKEITCALETKILCLFK